jgi:hypothetical protein
MGLAAYIIEFASISMVGARPSISGLPIEGKRSAVPVNAGESQFPEIHISEGNRITRWRGMKYQQSEPYGDALVAPQPQGKKPCHINLSGSVEPFPPGRLAIREVGAGKASPA